MASENDPDFEGEEQRPEDFTAPGTGKPNMEEIYRKTGEAMRKGETILYENRQERLSRFSSEQRSMLRLLRDAAEFRLTRSIELYRENRRKEEEQGINTVIRKEKNPSQLLLVSIDDFIIEGDPENVDDFFHKIMKRLVEEGQEQDEKYFATKLEL
ncbi:TPA: hypothetical protein DD449_05105 [Candidatus Berkelbacteria bacterium]|uniref:Uncharacterized protein n=1 Tax=Berkelbacteria bacterium GW2011_GWE1_39_12 TaxID=1618337 RepID=A0A0G4B3L5_9BACT|nr:MAG: hypothetical protein UT28_C0001G0639 [Berkelbacteria bacterium GW2011_GWE1_39_12]HBO61031.1 hypothetical protein [Candidatus Berkelbacteria bacterium]